MRRVVLAVCVITCPIGGCRYHGFEPESDDVPGAPDAGVDGGGPAGARCGGPGAVADDFADGVIAPQWRLVTTTYNDVVETGGALVIAPYNGPAGYVAVSAIDLRDAGIEVEVPTMVDTGTTATASFVVENRGLTVGFTQRAGTLTAVIDRANGRLTNPVPYDPSAHRWWRIADAGGTITLSTSPDATGWAPILTGTNVPFTGSAVVSLEADGTGAGTGLGMVSYQNLRAAGGVAVVGAAPWCKTATFSDPFDGSMIGYAWAVVANPAGTCDPRLAGGKLHIDQPGGACAASLQSAALYDLTASVLVLDVDAIADPPYGWGGVLAIADPAGAKAQLMATNHQLCGYIGDVDFQCTPYADQRFWRIREDAGSLVWEASPDRVDWVPIRRAGALLDLTRLRIAIGSYAITGTPAVSFASPGLNP